MTLKHVLVLGCQRSGTTLVAEVLGAHPAALLVDEPDGVYPYIDAWLDGRLDDAKRQLVACATRARDKYLIPSRVDARGAVADGVTHLVLKAPNSTFRYQDFAVARNDVRLVFATRDARDVVASMMRVDFVPMVENQTRRLEAHAELRESLSAELRLLKDPTVPEHMKMAVVWNIKTSILSRLESGATPVHWIRYEDLVRNPEAHVSKLLEFTGLPGPSVEHATVFRGFGPGLTDRARPIDTRSIGRFRERLTPEQAADVWDVAGPLMLRLGYERGDAAPVGQPARSAAPANEPGASAHPVNKPSDDPIVVTGWLAEDLVLLQRPLVEARVFLGERMDPSGASLDWVDPLWELAIRAAEARPNLLDQRWTALFERRAAEILAAGKWQPGEPWGWVLAQALHLVPEVLVTFPRARIVHVVRHPVTACRASAAPKELRANPVRRASLAASYRMRGLTCPSAQPAYLAEAFRWNHAVGAVHEVGQKLGDGRYVLLRAEVLEAAPEATLAALVELGIAKRTDGEPAPALDPEPFIPALTPEASAIWALCGELAKSLGYRARPGE